MARISIIYHHFPHYRAPVMRALARSTRNEYRFFGGREDFQGIKAFQGDDLVKIEPLTFLRDEASGKLDFTDFETATGPDFDATIVIGNPNMKGAWKAVRRARSNGLKTAYWTHGWLRPENWLKGKIRNFFFARADLVLTYGDRAHSIAAASGFDQRRIATIWNSLDWDAQTRLFEANRAIPRETLRTELGMPTDVPVILTISRVTDICKYDWLVSAAAKLRADGLPVELWMIGDGPALAPLMAQAKREVVPFHSQGAIYEEEVIARQIMAADCVASPGKVGLTAMHALAYGTPVVTHDDFNRQMPEVEAIIDGSSGAFFEFGSVDSLAKTLSRVLSFEGDTTGRRQACRASLEGRFTPQDQARLIDDAMERLLS